MPQNTSPSSQIMPQEKTLLFGFKLKISLQVHRDIVMVSIPPIGAAFIGTRMVQNNKSVMDFLNVSFYLVNTFNDNL
jgi:hypothetical protein